MTSYINCKHHHTVFIQSSRGAGGGESYRDHAWVCADCGLFHIFAAKNGVDIKIEFALCRDEQVKAAGQYARYLESVSP